MKVKLNEFFSNYIINVNSKALTRKEKTTCLVASIALGVCMAGIPHLVSLIYQKFVAKTWKHNHDPSVQKTNESFQNIFQNLEENDLRILADSGKLNEQSLEKCSINALIQVFKNVKTESEKLDANLETKSGREAKTLQCTLFGIKDAIYRKASELTLTPDQIQEVNLIDPEFYKAVEKICAQDSDSLPFISMTELTAAAASGIFSDTRPDPVKDETRSLHVTLEYEKAIAGGVGAVAQSLLQKMNEANLDARIVTPFYDLYKTDAEFKNAKFVGMITHELNGKQLKSSVYKIWGQRGTVPHYLIKPDPSESRIFDIKEANNVYSNVAEGSSLDHRSLYFASVVAALGATYKGRKHKKHFDIVHFHTWTATIGAHIIKDKYSPLRENAGLNKVHPVQHFHHGSLDVQNVRSDEIYRVLDIKDVPASVKKADVQEDIWLHVDGLLFVSPENKKNCVTIERGEGLHEVARHLQKYDRLVSVMNGITWNDHALTSKKAHGTFAIEPKYNDSGVIDITDYAGEKEKIKQALFEEGIVADPKKPLFLFVGRYSPEKGIDKLGVMAKEIIKAGGQCVVMGWGEGGNVPEDILDLQKIAEKHPDAFRVYTKREDQLNRFLDSGALKGNLIRGASDFLLMPSRFEGCAMVVWEGLARGNLVISSMGGGLKAQCTDLDDVGEDAFNSFGYENDEHADKNIAIAIQRSIKFYNEKKQIPGEWNKVVSRIFKESEKNDWLVKGGPVEQIQDFYSKVMKVSTSEETAERQELITKYYDKYQRLTTAKVQSYLSAVKNAAVDKIRNLFRRFRFKS